MNGGVNKGVNMGVNLWTADGGEYKSGEESAGTGVKKKKKPIQKKQKRQKKLIDSIKITKKEDLENFLFLKH